MFAASALEGLLASERVDLAGGAFTTDGKGTRHAKAAAEAYRMADAMLAARKAGA